MQDEDIDIIIREAASQHHPPYDEKAWEKMKQLLDKHLPQKKERKRWIFFLLIFLLLDGTLFLAIWRPWNFKSTIVAEKNSKNNTSAGDNRDDPNNVVEKINDTSDKKMAGQLQTQQSNTSSVPVSEIKENKPVNQSFNPNANKYDAIFKPATRPTVLLNKGKLTAIIKTPGTVNNNSDLINPVEDPLLQNDAATELAKKKTAISIVTPAEKKLTVTEKTDTTKIKKTIVAEKEKEKQKTVSTKDSKKPGKGFRNNFGISLSGGAELSYISLKRPGKITFFYGAGLSYTFLKRVTVRSGFYVTKKIYSAIPEEYNGTIYPNLNKIDGDCSVYEIPLYISYNFAKRKKHSWFGGAGISTYLMKKEAYNFEYKTPAGQYYYYKRKVDNENKHYFSVLTLSGGYQYNFNNRISVMAEPYVKLPLKEIGYGKMKLNNAGVLLTVTVKPFVKNK